MATESITEFFQRDHDRLDELFCKYRKNKKSNSADAEGLFNSFKQGLEQHITWEEQILFPLFEQKTEMMEAGPTRVMRLEHQEIKKLLNEIAYQIHTGESAIDSVMQNFFDTLKEHNRKEEEILYPWIDQAIPAQERKEILSGISGQSREKRGGCCGIHE